MVLGMKLSRFEHVLSQSDTEIDGFDRFGSAIGLHFSICDVLDASGIANEALARWDYHRGLTRLDTLDEIAERFDGFHEGEFAGDYDYSTVALASALVHGVITVGDLIYAGDVLERYVSVLRRAGLDY